MAKEFAGLIQGIDRLMSKLNYADVTMAEKLLDATFYEYPRPAWDTGELRSSGAAYIGMTKVAETPKTGQNPMVPTAWRKKRGRSQFIRGGNQSFGSVRMRTLHKATRTGGMALTNTVRGKITIVYRAQAAALMHEWTLSIGQGRKFTSPDAGPHYISAKLAKGNQYMTEIFREILT